MQEAKPSSPNSSSNKQEGKKKREPHTEHNSAQQIICELHYCMHYL